MAHDRRLLQVHRIHEREHIGGKIFHRVTTHRPGRIAMPTLVQNVNAILIVQQRQHRAERVPGISVTVQQDHRRSRRIAFVRIVQTNASFHDKTRKLHL